MKKINNIFYICHAERSEASPKIMEILRLRLRMTKYLCYFTFFVFAFSIILSGLSDIQTKNTNFTNKTTYTQITRNQHDCASVQENDNKDCPNACDTKSCDCVNHSCTGTISLFNLVENYNILPLPSDNGFSSAIEYKKSNVGYPIIHPPRV